MFRSLFRRWLDGKSRRSQQKKNSARRRERFLQPTLETLEKRVLLFKPYTHLAAASEAVQDVLDNGKVTLEGREYSVRPEIVQAIHDFPSYFNAGTIGPDGFPDLVMGQSIIHPQDTGRWLDHIYTQAWAAQTDPLYTPAEKGQILAWAYGFLSHAAGDLWAHTLVNEFAVGVFPGATEILTDKEKAAIAARHIFVEGYIGDATPGFDGNHEVRKVLPDGDVSDDSTPGIALDAPVRFIFNTLIQPNQGPAPERGAALDFFLGLRAKLDGAKVQTVTSPFDTVRNAFLQQWIDDIDDGLEHWGELGLAIARGLFDPQARRDLQNEEAEFRGPDTLDNLNRATVEDSVTTVDTVLAEAEPFIDNHLVSMLGAPDLVGDFLQFSNQLGDQIDTLVGQLGLPFNPLREVRDRVKDAAKDFIKDMIRQHFDVDLDLIEEEFKNPSAKMDLQQIDLGGTLGVVTLFQPGDHAKLDGYLGITTPNDQHHTGTDDSQLRDDVTFDPNNFAAFKNTVTLTKLLLLDGPTMDQVLTDLTGKPYTLYCADRPTVPAAGNIMLTVLPGVTESNGTPADPSEWLRVIDGNDSWRADGRGDNNGGQDKLSESDKDHRSGNGNFPLWESRKLRDPAFRVLFKDWQNGTQNFPDSQKGSTDAASADPNEVGSIICVNTTADRVDPVPSDANRDVDPNTPGQQISLRAAIQIANARSGLDTIHLPAGTYTLTITGTGEDAAATGDLDITDNVIITGSGAGVTFVNAGGIDRVFDVRGNISVDISHVTIMNGAVLTGTGGGINNPAGLLTITASTIQNNFAPKGGGIYNAVAGGLSMQVTASTLSGNTGQDGGGLFNDGVARLTNVTISGNQANNQGGGSGSGGGAFNSSTGQLTLTNATVAGNLAVAGGGLLTQGSTLLNHTLVADNRRGATGPRDDVKGTLVGTGSNNLIADGTGMNGLTNGSNGNRIGTGTSPIDAHLGPLQDNGGFTFTQALLTGSPAIDGGVVPAPTAVDQRGISANDGNGDGVVVRDIGAFEFVPEESKTKGFLADLSTGFTNLFGRLPAFGQLFNLPSINLPVVQEQFASLFNVGNRLGQIPTPTLAQSRTLAQMVSTLEGAGFQVQCMEGGYTDATHNIAGCSTSGDRIQLLYQRTVFHADASAPYDDSTSALLQALNSAANLDGSLAYGADLILNLHLGLDGNTSAGSFFLQGDSGLTLQIHVTGQVSASFSLPVAGLGMTVAGTAGADIQVTLGGQVASRRYRIGEILGDPTAILAPDVDGTANVNLTFTVTQNGAATDLAFGVGWDLTVTNGAIADVQQHVDCPDPDQFINAIIPILSTGLNQFDNSNLTTLLNQLPLPFASGQPGVTAPSPFDGIPGSDLNQPIWWQQILGILGHQFNDLSGQLGQGAYYTVGDQVLGTAQLRQLTGKQGLDLNSKPVKIGVISDGVKGLEQAVRSKDLPGDPPPSQPGLPGQVIVNRSIPFEDGAEGTAMLEIIHDMAPLAQLYFSPDGPGGNHFNDAVDWLVGQGVRIIVDDLHYLIEPLFSDGTSNNELDPEDPKQVEIAFHVRQVLAAHPDLLFVTSAGNQADRHYEAPLNLMPAPNILAPETAPRTIHYFQVGTSLLPVMEVQVSKPGDHDFFLQWSDTYQHPNRELHLLQTDAAFTQILNTDKGFFDEAWVSMTVTTTKPDELIYLAIEQTNVANATLPAPQITLFDHDSDGGFALEPQFQIAAGSAVGHPVVPDMLTVATVTFGNGLSTVADYSSRGPTIIRLSDGTLTTIHPVDVTGVDGVAVSGVAGFAPDHLFKGTSAAAPGVAAVAALLKGMKPDATRAELTSAIINGAVSLIGSPGTYDEASGFGRVDAVAAANKLGVLPIISIANVQKSADATLQDMVFTVSLQYAINRTVKVDYSFSDQSAIRGVDYFVTDGQLVFAPGETQKQIVVSIVGNPGVDPNKTFSVTLLNPHNGIFAGGLSTFATGTIVNQATPAGAQPPLAFAPTSAGTFSPASSPADVILETDPGLDSPPLTGEALLNALGMTVEHVASCDDLIAFFSGRLNAGTDLLRVSFDVNPDDFVRTLASFNLDLGGLGALSSLGLNGSVAGALSPKAHLVFGFDGSGFFLDQSSTFGGQITGTATATGSFGPFDATVTGNLQMNPTVSFAPVGQRLRLGDLAANVNKLQISLGDVHADLTLDLTSSLLDYIDADGNAANNTEHGGDPFRFVATASLNGVVPDQNTFHFTYSGIDIRNPDVNGDGQSDFTSAVLVEDMRRLAQDVLRGNRSVLSNELLQAFNVNIAPLTHTGLGDALQIGKALADFLITNTQVIKVVDFDLPGDTPGENSVEAWLNHGLPPTPQEIIRLKLDLGTLPLAALNTLQFDLTTLLPNVSNTSGLATVSNAQLSGQLVFGVDTNANPFYLLTAPDVSGAAVTTISGGFDLSVNLTGQPLGAGAVEVNNARASVSPSISVTLPSAPGGKLRIGTDVTDLTGFQVSLQNAAQLSFAADGATLFPSLPVTARVQDDNPNDTIPALSGSINVATGRLDLQARKLTATLGDLLTIDAAGVGVTFDPAAAGTSELVHINNAVATIPALTAGDKTPTVHFDTFGFHKDGSPFLSGAQLILPSGYSNGLNVTNLLPLRIDSIRINFPNPNDLNRFTLLMDGQFLMQQLDDLLPFTPIIQIGNQTFSTANNGVFTNLEIAVDSLRDGRIEPVNLGPITLGIADLTIAGTTFTGQITLGAYVNGQFDGSVTGFVQATNGSRAGVRLDVLPGSRLDFDGQGGATLNILARATLDAQGNVGPVSGSVSGSEINFGLQIVATRTTSTPFVSFVVTPSFTDLSVNKFTFQIANILELTGYQLHVSQNSDPNLPDATLDQVEVSFPKFPLLSHAQLNGVKLFDDGPGNEGAFLGFERAQIDTVTFTVSGAIGSGEPLLSTTNLQIKLTNLTITLPAGTISVGSVDVLGGSVTLLPDAGPNGVASATITTGSFDGTTGKLTLTADVTATVNGIASVSAHGTLAFGPGTDNLPLLSVPTATVTLPLLGDNVSVTVNDLQIAKNGAFTIASTVFINPGTVLDTLGLSAFLPFDINRMEISNAGGRVQLDDFDLNIQGNLNYSIFNGLPVKPVIIVGGADGGLNLSPTAAGFNLTFEVQDGHVRVKNLNGPLTLGFAGLVFGPATVGATITLGQFVGGDFILGNPFGASVDIAAGSQQFSVAGTGTLTTTGGVTTMVLDVAVHFPDFSTDLAGVASLAVQGLDARFSLTVQVDASLHPQSADLRLHNGQATGIDVTLGPANEALARFHSGPVQLNLDDKSKDLLTFTSITATLPALPAPLSTLSGTVNNFAITQDLKFKRLAQFGVQFTGLDNLLGEQFGLPDWFPIKIHGLGLELGTNFDTNPLDVVLVVSGGTQGNANFPVSASVNNLRINVDKLAHGQLLNAIESVDGVSGQVDPPVAVGPLTIGGGFGLDLVTFTNKQGEEEKALVAKISGYFEIAGIGAGVELVISQFGPLLASISTPLAVPLGPTGILLSGVEGGFVFGGPDFTRPEDPLDLLKNPTTFDPIQLDDTSIQTALLDLLQKNDTAQRHGQGPVFSWSLPFTMALKGEFTTVATPGILTGELNLAANAGDGHLKFLGSGQVVAFGMPLGQVGALLDLSNPLAPVYDLAFAAPAPGNPLAFLFPAQGTFTVHFDSKGLIETTLFGVKRFVDDLVTQGLSALMTTVAADLNADRKRPLAQLLFSDNPSVINATLLSDRVKAALPTDLAGLASVNFDKATKVGAAFLAELFQAATLPQNAALGAQLLGAVESSLKNSTVALLNQLNNDDRFNPRLEIFGLLQPTILGIPFGDPDLAVNLTIDKTGIGFGFSTSIQKTVQRLAGLVGPFGVGSLLVSMLSLGFTDRLDLTFKLAVPTAIGDVMTPPAGATGNPLKVSSDGDWLVGLGASLDFLGFGLADARGFLFKAGSSAVNDHTYVVDPSKPLVEFDPKGVDPKKFADGLKIPVTQEHQDTIRERGGILFNVQLKAPALLIDPVALIAQIPAPPHLDHPTDIINYGDYIGAVKDVLLADQVLAQMQIFFPSFESVLHVDPTGGSGQVVATAGNDGFAQVIHDAYFSGFSDAKILSIPLIRATVDATLNGFEVTTHIPLLADLEAKIDMGFRDVNFNELLEDLVAKAGLGNVELTNNKTATVLVPIPVGAATVSLDTDRLETVLSDTFGLPPNIFGEKNRGNAQLSIYSPAFGDPTDPSVPLIQRNGGIEFDATLNIENLFEDANFHFESPFFTDIIPDFVATAHVGKLAIPGLDVASPDLFRADLDARISNDTAGLKTHIDGDLVLLDKLRLDATADLVVDKASSTPGLFGEAALTLADSGKPDLDTGLFSLSGTFLLQVNTTNRKQPTQPGNGTLERIPAGPYIGVHIDGSLSMFSDAILLDGDFDLTVTQADLGLQADGRLQFPPLGVDEQVNASLVLGDGKIEGSFTGFGVKATINRFGCFRVETLDPVVAGFKPAVEFPLLDGGCDQHVFVDTQALHETDAAVTRNIRVQFSKPLERDLQVGYTIARVSAETGDLTPVGSGTVTAFQKDGANDPTFVNIPVTINSDNDGFDETLTIKLTPSTTSYSGLFPPALHVITDSAVLTIVDDDEPIISIQPLGSITLDSAPPDASDNVLFVKLQEGATGTLQLVTDGVADTETVTVAYSLVPLNPSLRTATEGKDFGIGSGTVTLRASAPGNPLRGDIPITTFGDNNYELHEGFELRLSILRQPENGPQVTLVNNIVHVTVRNDDSDIPPGALVFYDFDERNSISSYIFTQSPSFLDPRLSADDFRFQKDPQDRPNLALHYSSSPDFVRAVQGTGPALPTQQFTVEFWLQLGKQPVARASILSLGASTTAAPRLSITVGSDLILGYELNTSAGSFAGTFGRAQLGSWQHVALTYNGTQLQAFLDDTFQDPRPTSGTLSFAGTRADLVLGKVLAPNTDRAFVGSLDEFRLWTTALSKSDVALFSKRAVTGTETNLLIAFTFDEPIGTQAANLTGKGWSGQLGIGSGASIIGPFGIPTRDAAADSPVSSFSRYGPGAVPTIGVPKVEPIVPTADPTSAIRSDNWFVPSSDPVNAPFWTFTVHVLPPVDTDGTYLFTGLVPALNVTGIDFWDIAAPKGPTKWELRSSIDNFASVIATGSPSKGAEFNHQIVLFDSVSLSPAVRSVLSHIHPSQAVEFRLYGIGATGQQGSTGSWAVENVGLVAGILDPIIFNHVPVAPVLVTLPANAGLPVTIDPRSGVSDSDSDPIETIDATAPTGSGTLIKNGNGTFSFTPVANFGSDPSLTFKLIDRWGAAVSRTMQVIVNDPPVLTVPGSQTVSELTTISFTVSATDPDVPANTLTFTVSGLPAGASFDAFARKFTWTPTEAQAPGTFVVNFKVSDGSLADSKNVTITVNEVNQPPVLTVPGSLTANEQTPISFTVSATDPDLPANTLTFSATGLPAGATFDSSTQKFSWVPAEDQGPGTYVVTFKVSDGSLTDSKSVTITIKEANQPPTLTAPAGVTADEMTQVSFTVSATDPDIPANTLTLSASGLPSGASFNTSTQQFTWTPTEAQGPGSYPVSFTVSDGNNTITKSLVITINEVNRPPVALNDSFIRNPNTSISGNVLTNDSDPDLPANSLSTAQTSAPQFGQVSFGSNGSFTYIPFSMTQGQGAPDASDSFSYILLDGKGGSDAGTVTILKNTPPTANDDNSFSIVQGSAFGLSIDLTKEVSDAQTTNKNDLSYAIVQGLPSGGGTLSGTPPQLSYKPPASTGTFSFTYKATDPQGLPSRIATITITVKSSTGGTTGPGTFTLTPQSATVPVREHLPLSVTWTVPEGSWHLLDTVQVRVRDDQGTVLWVHFDEAQNTFLLVEPHSGRLGPAVRPGSPEILKTAGARLYMAQSSVVASGPTSPSVTLNFDVSFEPPAAGRVFTIELFATDDLGHRQGFDPGGSLTVTSPSDTVVPNATSPSQRLVGQVYRDLLDREAEPAGSLAWSALLDRGVSTSQVVQGIQQSPEYRRKIVQRFYLELLGRPAEPLGLSFWVGLLEQGATVERVRAGILGSLEYFTSRGGSTNDGFLRALYLDVLGRGLDPRGQAGWGQLLALGVSREAVAFGVLTSLEADRVLVDSLYETFLRRPAEPEGLDFAVNAMQQGMRDEALIAAILTSEEYRTKT